GLPPMAQHDLRRAPPAPAAFDHGERTGRLVDNQLLLVRRELDHPVPAVGITKRCKDLIAHAEVGMVHVRRLDRFRQAERELSKLINGHGLHPYLAASLTTVFTPRNVERAFSVFSSSALENSDSPCLFFDSQYSSRPLTRNSSSAVFSAITAFTESGFSGPSRNPTQYAPAAATLICADLNDSYAPIFTTSHSDRTNVRTSYPNAFSRAGSMRFSRALPSFDGDMNITLPDAMKVCTSVNPIFSNSRRRSSILTTWLPTLMARRNATYRMRE